MGYLADIVADARERHFGQSNPAYCDESVELTVPGESGKAAIHPDSRPAEPPFPLRPNNAVTVDSAETQGPDLPTAHAERPGPPRAKDIPEAAAPASAEQPLHQYLRNLSQQTLVARSEKILTQQQSPDAPSTAKTDTSPIRAQQQESSSDGHENTQIPAAKTTTDTRMDSSDKSAVPPVQDNGSAPPSTQTTIQPTQEHDTRALHDSQDPHPRRQLPRDAAIDNSRDRRSPPAAAHAPDREPHKSTPSRQYREPSSGAPQLRIEQINVVVESTKPDQERRSGLERDSDSASRYFLRSL
jgi:hypothetical protein